MKSIRAIIVDDEQAAREILADLLHDFSDVEVLCKESSADKAIVSILKYRPDIVFLDIDMPLKTGFNLVDELKNYDVCPTIIFVTAYDKYAIEAIKHAAFDYLVKPVDVDDLQLCISRYKAEKSHEQFTGKIESLLEKLSKERLRFNTRDGFILINVNEIVFCSAARNYTDIHLSENDEKRTVTVNLGKIAEMLPDNFLRIGKSTVINKQFLKEVSRKNKKCKLVCNSKEYVFDIPKHYIKELIKDF